MPALRQYHLFISHAWQYNDDYYRLVDLLDNANNFEWVNYSVPEHKPADIDNTTELAKALWDHMRPTQCVLVISGMYVAYRKWIKYEIEQASAWQKPIIGIKPWGNENLPNAVSSVATQMVGWHTSSIVEAVRHHSR